MSPTKTSRIYSIGLSTTPGVVDVAPAWTEPSDGLLPDGYASLVTVPIGERVVLLGYDPSAGRTDVYARVADAPYVTSLGTTVDLAGGPWDSLDSFVLGNVRYLLTYRRENGVFGFFQLADDLSVSPPYDFSFPRNTPTKGFTTVAPLSSVGGEYVLGYDADVGTVACFSVAVVPTSAGGIPPLLCQNVWYHHWAAGWKHFAFFRLGGANFFFKINVDKLNVNIDHLQDNPAAGSVEVGSWLQDQLPDALSVDLAATVPWTNDAPYVLTYIAASGKTDVLEVHADCLGWTHASTSMLAVGATSVVTYRIGDTSYALLYGAVQ